MLIAISGVLAFLILSFVVTGTSGESFPRDLFGLPIPTPPIWTSYVPFLGGIIGFIFELFSLHGLIEILIVFGLFYLSGIFLTLGDNKNEKTS